MANYRKGKDGALYFNATALTDATTAVATTGLTGATLITNVQDVTSNLTKDTVEVNSRANGGFKTKIGTLKDGTVTFKMLWKPTTGGTPDANFAAIRDAYLNDTEVAFWVLDQPSTVSGSQGVAGNFNVVNFSRAEPIGDVMTVDVELSPSSFTQYFIKA